MAISSGHSFQLHRQLYFYIAPLPLFTTTSCAFLSHFSGGLRSPSASFPDKNLWSKPALLFIALFARRPLGGVHKFYEIFIECAADIAGPAAAGRVAPGYATGAAYVTIRLPATRPAKAFYPFYCSLRPVVLFARLYFSCTCTVHHNFSLLQCSKNELFHTTRQQACKCACWHDKYCRLKLFEPVSKKK